MQNSLKIGNNTPGWHKNSFTFFLTNLPRNLSTNSKTIASVRVEGQWEKGD